MSSKHYGIDGGGNVNWTIVTSGVDENLSFRYRITRVPAPV